MKQHKWHKEIKAWADGAEIQTDISEVKEEPIWIDVTAPAWDINDEYRIKPQPKEPQYYYVWQNHKGEIRLFGDGLNELPIEYKYIGKIKLEDSE
jgi:hypothetical protein